MAIASTDIFKGLRVIDTDTHWSEPHDLWSSRAPGKFKELVPHVRKDPKSGRDTWFIMGDTFFGNGGGASVVRKNGEKTVMRMGIDQGMQFNEIDMAAYDPKSRVAMMDKLGIWAQIVYPNLAGFGTQNLLKLDNAEVRNMVVSLYNDYMSDVQKESGQRVFPMALVPFWDIKEAVKEVQRASEMGMRGITMCSDPDRAGFPDLPNKYWDPLWEVCGELNMPINFHIGASEAGMKAFQESPWPSMGPQQKLALGSALIYLDNARVFANLLYSDILERYPKTRWVSVESGIGWVPFMLESLEWQLDETAKDEMLDRKFRPTELFHRQVYVCFWFEQLAPRKMLEDIGVDNILFETDYPHPTCLYPNNREHATAVLSGWSEEIRRKVLQDNAAKLYRIALK